MSLNTSRVLIDVQDVHMLNHESLLKYASANIRGFPASPSSFFMKQFGYGQSNPTYLLEVGDGESVEKYVLRKKPPGKLLESAHAVEREFQVLRALSEHTGVPVPKVYCLCTDPSVIGTSFYIMEYLDGRIFMDPRLPGLVPHSRRAIYIETTKALASLHHVDADVIGLNAYGRKENYCKRQIERWAKQYIASTGPGKSTRNPKMIELSEWLKHHIPFEDISGTMTGLVHGDFRIDNVVFHPVEDRVIGIIDWELSTLGNQMTDVAYSCLPYIVDINLDNEKLGEGFEITGVPEGIPSIQEHLADYCALSRKPWPACSWKFYIAFSMFRGASIYAGVHNRWIMGNASGGERARHAGNQADGLVDAAWTFISKTVVLPCLPPGEYSKINHYPLLPKEITHSTSFNKVSDLRNRLIKFMEYYIYPMETEFYRHAQSSARWTAHPEEQKLVEVTKKEGLWNLWLTLSGAEKVKMMVSETSGEGGALYDLLGAGLSNLEYGCLCEIMGRSLWAPQLFNCGAPDTGNMEVLLHYGTTKQQLEWLVPLLQGKIRSAFAMTEPQVSSSDATNIECSIQRQNGSYLINGNKWWTSGAMDPRCRLLIVMGKTDPSAAKHKQHSMILVDIRTPGVKIRRPLAVFGFDDAPHGHAEISFQNVTVPVDNIIWGEGRGFEIAQGRLGPGRLHHCMRLVGMADRGMQMMAERALSRRAFGKFIAQHGSFRSDIAKCRIELEKVRLLVREAADRLDRCGNKQSRGVIAMAKVAAPNMALGVLDTAIQVHGAAGVSSDTVLAHLWATARALRIADGPDEVHLGTIAKLELLASRL